MGDLIINSLSGQDRSQLPANRDRASNTTGWTPSNPTGWTPPSTREDEALIGVYPYSGADIKLVVHLPPEDPRASARTEQEINDELQQAVAQRDNAASTADSISQGEARLIELRQEEAIAISFAEATAEGSAERTAAEEDVAEIREQIAAFTSAIQEARRGVGDIEELDQRISDLSAQLRALQDGHPIPPTSRTKTLAEIQTLSLSSHREKYPVRTLGSVYIRSVTRGVRTVSGSIVFTTFHNHVMREFLESAEYRSTGVGDWDRFRYTSYLMDQIPPLDISISFNNEYGNTSYMAILGVEFMNEGMVMSIEDLFLEGTAQYIARDFDPIRSVAHRRMIPNRGVGRTVTGSNIMIEDLRRRVAHRNIPWI
jgi:hypothetical protein